MNKKLTPKKKNTSISIGKYYEEIIKREISSGRYSSASEVIRASLWLLEKEELKADKTRNNEKKVKTKTNGIANQYEKKENQT